jgi:6-pyruvoyltetrahydropterin/6-carboxytetrahydropterin synthase
MITCTRKLEFDAGHRVTRHESKCAHVHGHRYVVEITCGADALDAAGRVVDFGAVKAAVKPWLDDNLDHGYVHHPDDTVAVYLRAAGHKCFAMPADLGEPTAENIAALVARAAQRLLPTGGGLTVQAVRVWETPNCRADWTAG